MKNGVTDFCSGIQHIGIPTADMEASLLFYHSLGFETIGAEETPDGPVRFVQMKNLVVELYQNAAASGSWGAIDHVAIDCGDIEGCYAAVSALGLHQVTNGVEDLPFWEHGIKYFIIEGPNREKIEFAQRLTG